jgi:hypothetical protein
MTDEELMKRLRKRREAEFIDGYERVEWEDEDALEAADRIEALINLNEALVELMDDRDAKLAKAVEALGSIELYGSDTLSGRTDGPADAKWHREGVKEMRDRARAALAEIEGEKG